MLDDCGGRGNGERDAEGLPRDAEGLPRAGSKEGEWEGEGGGGRVDRKDGGRGGGNGEAETRRGTIWKGR